MALIVEENPPVEMWTSWSPTATAVRTAESSPVWCRRGDSVVSEGRVGEGGGGGVGCWGSCGCDKL